MSKILRFYKNFMVIAILVVIPFQKSCPDLLLSSFDIAGPLSEECPNSSACGISRFSPSVLVFNSIVYQLNRDIIHLSLL